MFNTVTIIGVGLIGSSLSRALLERGVAKKVIGCSRKKETLDEAIALEAISEGRIDIVSAADESDLVVIATPLSTYESIAKKLSESNNKKLIITDAGSVKNLPTQHILNHLNKDQKPHFVPGHPIAGTEKSGPSAGFASLYENRSVLLTPHKTTDESATEKVRAMWEEVGANVRTLDMKRHDKIYAETSHAVQFACSAYGLLLQDAWDNYGQDIKSNVSPNVLGFTRLMGSDPVMWRDIFLTNQDELNNALEAMLVHLRAYMDKLSSAEITAVEKQLEYATERRRELQQYSLKQITYASMLKWPDNPYLSALLVQIPEIICASLVSIITDEEVTYLAGAGFFDTTSILLCDNRQNMESLIFGRDYLIRLIQMYIGCFERMHKAVETPSDMEALLKQSQEMYTLIREDA